MRTAKHRNSVDRSEDLLLLAVVAAALKFTDKGAAWYVQIWALAIGALVNVVDGGIGDWDVGARGLALADAGGRWEHTRLGEVNFTDSDGDVNFLRLREADDGAQLQWWGNNSRCYAKHIAGLVWETAVDENGLAKSHTLSSMCSIQW